MKLKMPIVLGLLGFFLSHSNLPAAPTGWFSWRGPNQNGTSAEKNLPDTLDEAHPLWTADFPGQSTAVAFQGRLYIMGYLGQGPELSEGVACFDANTGQKLWQKLYLDFLSDTIYNCAIRPPARRLIPKRATSISRTRRGFSPASPPRAGCSGSIR